MSKLWHHHFPQAYIKLSAAEIGERLNKLLSPKPPLHTAQDASYCVEYTVCGPAVPKTTW